MRATNGGEQHSIGPAAGREGAGRQRFTCGINGSAPDGLGIKAEAEVVLLGNHLQQLPRHGRDLWADAVTGQQSDAIAAHQRLNIQALNLLSGFLVAEAPQGAGHLRQLVEGR